MKAVSTLLFFLTLGIITAFGQLTNEEQFSDLPPTSEYGKCYAKCKTPDVYETFFRKVTVSSSAYKMKKIPAVYETVKREVLVQEGGVNYKIIPATYKTIKEKVVVEPEKKMVNLIPAEYETRTRKVMVQEETGKWVKKKKDPNCFSENPEDCLIACFEKIPAKYEKETYEVLVAAERKVEKIIPPVYKTITRQVVDEPEKTIEIPYDPIYKTVAEKVLVSAERTVEEMIPAVYKEVEEKRLVQKGGYSVWTEILCAAKTSASTVRKVQRALRAEGYSIGVVDGVLGSRTQVALKQFQTDKGLPIGNLNFDTLNALGINY